MKAWFRTVAAVYDRRRCREHGSSAVTDRRYSLRLLCSIALVAAAGFAAPAEDLRLIDAVKNRDRAAVRVLMDQHVNVNAAQPDGTTALAWAVNRDDQETADLLIRAGAKVNTVNDY